MYGQQIDYLRQVKNLTTVDARVYGATGNGTTDDTTALAAAITAASGKTLLIPAGTYKTTSTLTIPASTTVQCQTSTIKKYHNNPVITVTADNVSIIGCTIDGNQAGAYTGYGVSVSGASGFTFKNGAVQNAKSYGILLTSSATNVEISGSTFTGNKASAIASTLSTSYGRIVNNRIDMTGADTGTYDGDGIQLKATGGSGVVSHYTIADNVVILGAQPDSFCIEIWRGGGTADRVKYSTVSNNVCKVTTQAFGGLSIVAEDTSVTGNSLYGKFTGAGGIEIVTAKRVSAVGNVIDATADSLEGIMVNKSEECVISGNSVRGVSDALIRLYADAAYGDTALAKNHVVTNNVLTFNGTATATGIAVFCNDATGNCSNNVIAGNVISGTSNTQGVGIGVYAFSATTDNNLIANNVIKTVGTALDRYAANTNTTWAGNSVSDVTNLMGGAESTTDFYVLRPLIGSTTWDPASVAAGGSVSTTVTLSGCLAGYWARASFSALTSESMDLIARAGTGAVYVTLRNYSASPIDIGIGTLRATCERSY